MTLGYTKQLSLHIWRANVIVQKIYGLSLDIFRMVIASFQVQNKLGKVQFF